MPKRDKTPKKNTAPDAGTGTVTIEADSVEEAMHRLATEVGDSAEIVDARKVQRGGIGGFFAKERVQLTARAGTPSQDEPDAVEGLAGVLDRMTRDAEAQETQFATMLRRELGSDKRDLGLDTFLEAVGWDDRTSADEAAKAHTAVGEIAAAITPPNPNPSSVQGAAPAAITPPNPNPSSVQEAAPAAITPPNPNPPSVQRAAPAAMAPPNPNPSSVQGAAPAAMAPPVEPPTMTEEAATTAAAAPPAAPPLAAAEAAPDATGPIADAAPSEDPPLPRPIVVQRTGTSANLPGPSLISPGAPRPPLRIAEPVDDIAADDVAVDDIPAWRTTADGGEPAGMGAVAWRTMDLVRHGVPTEIVAAVADIDPNDDIAWITALAGAIAPYCGRGESIDTVLLGTNAYQLAEALSIEWVEPGQTAPYEGSFASYVSTDSDHREWLEFVRGTRHIHYVIGGDQAWKQALVEAPNVVSWFDESALIDALYLAVAFDAQLGYGVLPGRGGCVTRIYPVDVALAIRSMMERR